MLMDIACPAELIRVEQALFGGGRRQAYITFLNESAQAIIGVSGLCSFRDEQGNIVTKTRLTFDGLDGRPGKPFTCHLALDGYPPFKEADMILESVLFDGGEIWELNTARLMDCEPPPLPEGPERNALISQAGPDAVCFPEKRDTLWICVCGRFNRLRWLSCRRCSRFRDEVLRTFHPAALRSRHAEHLAEARERDMALRRENAARQQAAQRRYAQETAAQRQRSIAPTEAPPEHKGIVTLRIMSLILAIALAVIGVGWFLQREFAKNIDYPALTLSDTMPPVDYLQPLR